MNCHQAPWTETIGTWSNCRRTIRNGNKFALVNNTDNNPCMQGAQMQYELGSPTGPRREVADQVIRPEWVAKCLENTVEMLSVEVEALRAENEKLKAEGRSASRQLRTIAGILGS